MSMLAERKRKTKWVINPTKKPLWKSGGIKIGKELMVKMGWTPGKGLGLREQGMQEPLKVSHKNDTKGMGFKENDKDWIEHQNEFNSLLSQLINNNVDVIVKPSTEEKNKIKSLEEESKKSKARIHYKKFTRGKDLAQYSENDLACILGTNKTKKDKIIEENLLKKENEKQTKEGYETSFGVTTINSGSIQDYFKKKWGADKHKSGNCDAVDDMNENNFISEQPLDATENEGEGGKEKRKGRKRKLKLPADLITENDSQVIETKILNGMDFKSEKPKHKKKKHLVNNEIEIKQESDELSGVTNCQNELSYDDKSVNKTQIMDSDSLCRKRKKKKTKSRDEVEKNEEEAEEAIRMDVNESLTDSQMDCCKKNVSQTGILNMEIEEFQLVNVNTKRKKSMKILEDAVKKPQSEIHVKTKKKKKGKKIKKQSDKISIVEEDFKDGEKSEKVSLEVDTTNETKTLEPLCLEEIDATQDTKKKKKKRKHEKETQPELENTDLFFATENPKVKKKNSKKEKYLEKQENEKVKKESEAEPSEDVKLESSTNHTSKDLKSGEKDSIYSHKLVLFRKKRNQIILPSYYSNERVLNLICGAEIQQFKGSNLSEVVGYGVGKETGKRKEMS